MDLIRHFVFQIAFVIYELQIDKKSYLENRLMNKLAANKKTKNILRIILIRTLYLQLIRKRESRKKYIKNCSQIYGKKIRSNIKNSIDLYMKMLNIQS